MDRAAAMAILGVTEQMTPEETRSRYLDLVRAHHPDVAASTAVDVANVTEAYRVVRATDPPAGSQPASHIAVAADGDTLVLDLPPDEAFFAIVDLAWAVGDVTYIDADAGLVEIVAALASGVTCSIVVSLQGRSSGSTDAFCTITPLGQGEAPPVAMVVDELAAILRGRH